MKNEKFKIIQFIRELVIMIDEQMDNFPKKDIEIKNRIRNSSYDLLELAYEANTTEDDGIKISIINKCIAKAKVFKKLPKKENLFPTFKPYTKERMTKSSKANINEMNEEEAKEYLRLKSLHFIEMKKD